MQFVNQDKHIMNKIFSNESLLVADTNKTPRDVYTDNIKTSVLINKLEEN